MTTAQVNFISDAHTGAYTRWKMSINVKREAPTEPPHTRHIKYIEVEAEETWFWTTYWQEMVRASDDDIAQGRIMTFETVDELIDELNR